MTNVILTPLFISIFVIHVYMLYNLIICKGSNYMILQIPLDYDNKDLKPRPVILKNAA